MQILAGELRQPVELALQRFAKPRILVAKARGRIPHLKVEVRRAFLVVEVRPLTVHKNLGGLEIVDGVAKRAVLTLEFEEFRRLCRDSGIRQVIILRVPYRAARLACGSATRSSTSRA